MTNKEKNAAEMLEKAKKLVVKHKLFFIEDIVALLPISKPTFYEYFKIGSKEFAEIKELLEYNRVEVKSSMRSKWYLSNAPALQIALMKLISTDEEAHRLNGSRVDITTGGEKLTGFNVGFKKDIDGE